MTIPRDEVVRMAREAGIDLVDGEIYGSTNGAAFAFATLIRERTIEECKDALDREALLAHSSYAAGLSRGAYVVSELAAAIRAMK
jgi:hypothetical protein